MLQSFKEFEQGERFRQLSSVRRSLWAAAPHQFGAGKIHLIWEDRTKCGKFLNDVPGSSKIGTLKDVTCTVCRRSFQSFVEQEESRKRWKEKMVETMRARAEQSRQWWDQYNNYLQTETWNAKRTLVLNRANHICEGCGQAKATQAHHTQYPQDCAPGSAAWMKQEKLFHLVAVCRRCHEELHSLSRSNDFLINSDENPQSSSMPKVEMDDDLVGLGAENLSTLAAEYTSGDAKVFAENYGYFKRYFEEKELEAQSTLEPNGGPYACLRCGGSIEEDFQPDSWPPDFKVSRVEVIRKRYACWVHIHDLGSHFCSYCCGKD